MIYTWCPFLIWETLKPQITYDQKIGRFNSHFFYYHPYQLHTIEFIGKGIRLGKFICEQYDHSLYSKISSR